MKNTVFLDFWLAFQTYCVTLVGLPTVTENITFTTLSVSSCELYKI